MQSERLIPADGEPDCGIDQPNHAVRLGEISPQFAIARIDMLRQQAVTIAMSQQFFEKIARFFISAQSGDGVDVPKSAHQKGVFRHAEII